MRSLRLAAVITADFAPWICMDFPFPIRLNFHTSILVRRYRRRIGEVPSYSFQPTHYIGLRPLPRAGVNANLIRRQRVVWSAVATKGTQCARLAL
jgi:hypothetical protein